MVSGIIGFSVVSLIMSFSFSGCCGATGALWLVVVAGVVCLCAGVWGEVM